MDVVFVFYSRTLPDRFPFNSPSIMKERRSRRTLFLQQQHSSAKTERKSCKCSYCLFSREDTFHHFIIIPALVSPPQRARPSPYYRKLSGGSTFCARGGVVFWVALARATRRPLHFLIRSSFPRENAIDWGARDR